MNPSFFHGRDGIEFFENRTYDNIYLADLNVIAYDSKVFVPALDMAPIMLEDRRFAPFDCCHSGIIVERISEIKSLKGKANNFFLGTTIPIELIFPVHLKLSSIQQSTNGECIVTVTDKTRLSWSFSHTSISHWTNVGECGIYLFKTCKNEDQFSLLFNTSTRVYEDGTNYFKQ